MSVTQPEILPLLERVKKKRAYVHERFNADRTRGCRPEDVRQVLVIDSASRSGSSFLYFLLSHHRNVLSLNGEGSLFERLHGIGIPRSAQDSDAIKKDAGISDETLSLVANDILRDAGTLSRINDAEGWPGDSYVADSVQRLILQYPEIDLDPDQLHRICAKALADHPSNGTRFSSVTFWKELLKELALSSIPVSPAHYDLQETAARGDSANHAPPCSRGVLEDPPFIVPEPRVFASRDQLAGKTLLLKSPSHSYRMWMVRGLFPNAKYKFIVLYRNPAAAISSLIDGWQSDGFYSHNLEHIGPPSVEPASLAKGGPLAIGGYSRADRPWTTKWWKFDLPPAWHDFRSRTVEDVCGLQWSSANQHIFQDIERKVVDEHIVVKYESLLEPVLLAKEMARISEFAGLENAHFRSDDTSRPVMAVTPPSPGKWRKRKKILAPLLQGKSIEETARKMGYEPREWESWA